MCDLGFRWGLHTPWSHRVRQRIMHCLYDILHPAPTHIWGWSPSAILVAHTYFSMNTTITDIRPILVCCDLAWRACAREHAVWPRGYKQNRDGAHTCQNGDKKTSDNQENNFGRFKKRAILRVSRVTLRSLFATQMAPTFSQRTVYQIFCCALSSHSHNLSITRGHTRFAKRMKTHGRWGLTSSEQISIQCTK